MQLVDDESAMLSLPSPVTSCVCVFLCMTLQELTPDGVLQVRATALAAVLLFFRSYCTCDYQWISLPAPCASCMQHIENGRLMGQAYREALNLAADPRQAVANGEMEVWVSNGTVTFISPNSLLHSDCNGTQCFCRHAS